MGLDGQRQQRITGFHKPSNLSYLPDGRLLVFDLATREVSSLVDTGVSFALGRTWRLPPESADPAALYSDTPDALLMIDRRGTIFRFSADSNVQQTKLPSEVKAIASSALLPDGGILVLVSEPEDLSKGLFVLRPESLTWTPVTVQGKAPSEAVIPNGIAVSGNTLYLWRGGNSTIPYGNVSGNVLTLEGELSHPGPSIVAPDSQGGVSIVSLAGKVARLSVQGAQLSEYQFINIPLAATFDAKRNSLLLLHEYPRSEEWPKWRNSVFSHQYRPFNWGVFWPIFISAICIALAWAWCACRWGYEKPPEVPAGVSGNRQRFGWYGVVGAIALLCIIAYGLQIAWGAQARLLAGLGKEVWRFPYVLGACLVGVAVEAWRRWHPASDEPKRFLRVLKEPAPTLGIAYLFPLIAIAILSGVLYVMGIDRQYNSGYREAVFFAGWMFVIGLLVVDVWVCRVALREWMRREWPFFSIPLLVGLFTFFYKLEDVPYNTHFDFTLNGFVAEQFLRGAKDGGWDWGFVPAPVIGSVPEILGFLIAGFTPFGYRFGNSLFNLSAIFAVYLLGRAYRNPRVGFWAAIILAGNAPFIHFGRLMSNGSSATVALWATTALALALKYKRTSLWLFMGVVAGAAFYQWPVARVGITAGAIMYALVCVRFPLRQLAQFPHHVFGLAGVALLIAPLLGIWMAYPERFMARAYESLPGLKLGGAGVGFDLDYSTFDLFFRSLGWIFNEYDRSSQGSISPGFNSVEAVLFACGMVVLCIEGISLNILLGLTLVVTLLVCGAWSVGPPWYTRVLPSAPIVCVVIARAIEGFHNLFSPGGKKVFQTSFLALSAALLFIAPWSNFKKYHDYETAVVRRNNLYPMTAIGHALHKTGPNYSYVFLLLGEPSWRFAELPAFAHMLPYIANLKLKECYDIREELPVKPDESKAFLVQLKRKDIDIPVIQSFHPDARVTTIEDINHDKIAYLVLVDKK
jgi:hypothetical protein